jgi:hypothetical protein
LFDFYILWLFGSPINECIPTLMKWLFDFYILWLFGSPINECIPTLMKWLFDFYILWLFGENQIIKEYKSQTTTSSE